MAGRSCGEEVHSSACKSDWAALQITEESQHFACNIHTQTFLVAAAVESVYKLCVGGRKRVNLTKNYQTSQESNIGDAHGKGCHSSIEGMLEFMWPNLDM